MCWPLRAVSGYYDEPHQVDCGIPSIPCARGRVALDRTRPGLPMKEGRYGTITHDYVRHGTTTLFAALNVLDGTALGRCMQRHRHQEFIRFLNAAEAAVPAGKV